MSLLDALRGRNRGVLAPIVLFGGIVLLVPARATAHFKITDPTKPPQPATVQSWMSQDATGGPQKNGPCGAVPNIALGDSQGTPVANAVTVVQAGQKVTIPITITIAHPGWFRISLHQGASSGQSLTTLPDPKAQAGTNCTPAIMANPVWSPTQPVLADGLPAGSTASTNQSGTKTFQVTIPSSASCSMAQPCTLQAIMVMTDHPVGDCYYHHCADLSVGSAATGGTTGSGGSNVGTGGSSVGTGGSSVGTGGAISTGGVTGTGGANTATGGSIGTGGAGTGGNHGTGGGAETGGSGASASGGAGGSNVSGGTGGASGTGGQPGGTTTGFGRRCWSCPALHVVGVQLRHRRPGAIRLRRFRLGLRRCRRSRVDDRATATTLRRGPALAPRSPTGPTGSKHGLVWGGLALAALLAVFVAVLLVPRARRSAQGRRRRRLRSSSPTGACRSSRTSPPSHSPISMVARSMSRCCAVMSGSRISSSPAA